MRKQVIYMLLLSLAILIIIAAITQWSSREVNESRLQIERSLIVNEQLELYLSYAKDIETGVRGYAMSGDKAYLDSYTTGLLRLKQTQRRLGTLIKDEEQLRNLPHLIALAHTRIGMAHAIKSSVSMNEARMIFLEGKGKKAMDALREHVDVMHHHEMFLLNQAREQERWTTWVDQIVVTTGFIVILLLQFGAFVIINNEMTQRQASNIQLEKINKELEAFSYSVSHDLRSPLRSISGFSQTLLNHKANQLDTEGRDFLERIIYNAQRMGTLIDDLLQLSRLSRAELNKQTVNLSEIAQQIVYDLRRDNPDRQVDVAIEPDLVVSGDQRLLHVALENLISNAWKFTSKTEHSQIVVGKDHAHNTPTYFVRDNGAGFDMQYAHKLFGAFQRLHAMEDFSGNGIGLTTVQRIMHRHGGTVWAEGEPNKGATFFFTV